MCPPCHSDVTILHRTYLVRKSCLHGAYFPSLVLPSWRAVQASVAKNTYTEQIPPSFPSSSFFFMCCSGSTYQTHPSWTVPSLPFLPYSLPSLRAVQTPVVFHTHPEQILPFLSFFSSFPHFFLLFMLPLPTTFFFQQIIWSFLPFQCIPQVALNVNLCVRAAAGCFDALARHGAIENAVLRILHRQFLLL